MSNENTPNPKKSLTPKVLALAAVVLIVLGVVTFFVLAEHDLRGFEEGDRDPFLPIDVLWAYNTTFHLPSIPDDFCIAKGTPFMDDWVYHHVEFVVPVQAPRTSPNVEVRLTKVDRTMCEALNLAVVRTLRPSQVALAEINGR